MAAKKQTAKAVKGTRKKANTQTFEHGKVYVTATFNNTLVTVTSDTGDAISWSSSGAKGFRGTRKSTPYAAGLAVEDALKKATDRGMKSVDIFVKGPGSGRDASLRAVKSAGLSISSIADITPMPHNGPRSKKKRRM